MRFARISRRGPAWAACSSDHKTRQADPHYIVTLITRPEKTQQPKTPMTGKNHHRIQLSMIFVGLLAVISVGSGQEEQSTTHNARTVRFFPVDKGFRVSGLVSPDGTNRTLLVDPVMPDWSDPRDQYAYRYHSPFEGVTTYTGHVWNYSGSGKPYGRDPGSSVMVRYIGPLVFGLVVESDGTAWIFERNLYEPTYGMLRVDRNGVIDRGLLPLPLRDTSSIREWSDNHHPAPPVWSHGNNAIGYELSYTREGSMGLFVTAFVYPDSGTTDWASFGVQGWMPQPELLFPGDDDTLFAGEVTFRWSNPNEEMALYTAEHPATGPAVRGWTQPNMKPGVYFWSVKAKWNGRSSFTRQRRLVIIPRPEVKKEEKLEVGNSLEQVEVVEQVAEESEVDTVRVERPDIE